MAEALEARGLAPRLRDGQDEVGALPLQRQREASGPMGTTIGVPVLSPTIVFCPSPTALINHRKELPNHSTGEDYSIHYCYAATVGANRLPPFSLPSPLYSY